MQASAKLFSGTLCVYAGVSTSGMSGKHPGRVGDSPLPGAGLYAGKLVGYFFTQFICINGALYMGQKSKPDIFGNNFVYCWPIFIIFDTYTL